MFRCGLAPCVPNTASRVPGLRLKPLTDYKKVTVQRAHVLCVCVHICVTCHTYSHLLTFNRYFWHELESNYITEQIDVEKVTVVLIYMFR